MGSDEQPSTSAIGDEVRGWVDAAAAVTTARHEIASAAATQSAALLARTAKAHRDNRYLWHVIPLRAEDQSLVQTMARASCVPAVHPDVQRELDRLTTEVAAATEDLRKVTGFGRLLLFGETRNKANQAAQFLADYRRWFLTSGIAEAIAQAKPVDDPRIRALTVRDVLTDSVGFKHQLPDHGQTARLEDSKTFAILPNATAVIRRAAAQESQLRKAAVDAGNIVRSKEADRMLADMSVERLREATRDKIRIGALTANGITTVLDVLANEEILEHFDGIGQTSATRIRAAARTLRQTTYDEMPMRIDIKNRTPEHTDFLRHLRAWDAARRATASSADMAIVEELAPVAAVIDNTVTHAIVIPTALSTVQDFRDAVQIVARAARGIAAAQDGATVGDPWEDFLTRPSDYFALLAELGFITEDDEKTHGDLPTEIVEAVRRFELKGDYLTASLRGYQSFAARFALVQRKVIIGDEMGLGKTVEAIAAIAHLRAKGEQNFLVVCPAAVVTNWVREVNAKSKLSAHRLHGPDRQWAARNWQRNGGVGVTTFETLRWLIDEVSMPTLGCVVIDEAHYIKNPDARRSKRTSHLINRCERAILLTGTPLENRLDEFRNLVGYLRPDLVLDANEFAPKKFRRQVAPAYLRRNQEDVLTELPDLVEVDEWVPMSPADVSAYRAAVEQRNFMAMRQAGMRQGRNSTKMQRLIEIVEEAEDNGRRVVVFSHFLDVLNDVARHMPGRVFGPLTGSVAANQRQVLVDDFSAAQKGAVLVAQIVAGGVGLNIQAASVVVICEPQLKPTTEWQAIARAHRMGQLESVQVHRLLSDEGVDQRVREILATKKSLFESFARESDLATSAPEAYDITEAELARTIIAAERERLLGGPAQVANGDNARVTQPAVSTGSDIGVRPVTPTPAAHTVANNQPKTASSGLSKSADQLSRSRARSDFSSSSSAASAHDSFDADGLAPYPVFDDRLAPISQTSPEQIMQNVVRIVAQEGPVTGWRVHQVYSACSAGSHTHEEFSRSLNRAISAAEKRGLIVSDNPLKRTGNKPRTFRLPTQSAANVRQLGPRTLDIVPPNEVRLLCDQVVGGKPLPDEEIFARIARKLKLEALSAVDRDAIVAACRLTANR
ncbi:DEAD/DEAH box helicase [Mycolicibacterium gilvum]|uniref:DNA/RNA helicase, superfamily II, SNF2 family n=1 Tax=Mycolicibacterium gilvum (strain DSM 45189 / LMG 24558 / Spyr1) TaxID=278137 RepID=E6TGN4_MYCSR|nr:DEAD/DEAH box helicase [Mycolicibacterium gilvum]ADU01204.1 DNA/RNA helicase, superfamily II, SNF2 family [Mycolicibacterium gilvum Spyr1]